MTPTINTDLLTPLGAYLRLRDAGTASFILESVERGRLGRNSWMGAGSRIVEFDEAAERMGVDVMRWTYANARPEDNILFGWHAADEARRELLVLWNVYAFFVTYASLAGWTPGSAAPPVADTACVVDSMSLTAAAPNVRTWEIASGPTW